VKQQSHERLKILVERYEERQAARLLTLVHRYGTMASTATLTLNINSGAIIE
jgi:hypothetical protein